MTGRKKQQGMEKNNFRNVKHEISALDDLGHKILTQRKNSRISVA